MVTCSSPATDSGGRITFVNQAFIQISGFSEQELVGAPHNIVRHPGMPKAAFGDLWTTIKAGKPWEGLVKNRAKSGDYYWVHANVTPVVENGQILASCQSAPDRSGPRSSRRSIPTLPCSTVPIPHLGCMKESSSGAAGSSVWVPPPQALADD